MTTPAGMRVREAAAYVGVSRNTLLRYGPKPIRIGPRTVVWTRAILNAWLAAKADQNFRHDADTATENAINAIRKARNAPPRGRKR